VVIIYLMILDSWRVVNANGVREFQPRATAWVEVALTEAC